MPLTTVQLIEVRRQVGATAPTDADLNAIYDRTGSVADTIIEVLETRYATLASQPASFSIPGEYSQSYSAEQLKALRDQIDQVRDGSTGGAVRIIPARMRGPRRNHPSGRNRDAEA